MKKIKELKNKLENNKPLLIIFNIFKAICWILLVLILIVILVQKFSNNDFAIGGYRIFNVRSESMKTEYAIGDIILIEEVSADDLKVGDNVTYIGKEGDFEDLVVTHKIVDIRVDEDGSYYFTTKGTENDTVDPEISYSQIYGKVLYKTIILSYISRIMTNIYAYYALFTIVGIISSYQIVKIVIPDDEEDDENEEEN